MLTIINEVRRKGRLMYLTQCECGKQEIKRKDWVKSGRTTSCKSCSCKRTASKYPPPVNKKGCGAFSGTHYLAIKHGAKRRNIEFNLTPEYLWNLYIDQQGLCALTGIQIHLSRSLKGSNVNWDAITASLDRKDNSKGYLEGNVWWVHKEINRLKNNYSIDELLYWSRLLVKHGNPEPSLSSDASEGATTRDQDSLSQ